MKQILYPLIMVLFVIAGGVGADFLRTQGAAAGEAHGDATHSSKSDKKKNDKDKHGDEKSDKESHGKKKASKDKHAKDKKSKDKHGKKKGKDSHGKSSGDHTSASSGTTYLKFKRQFVVPVMDQGSIDALVIMNINLVLSDNAPSGAYNFEPKLRDAITRELLDISNSGLFGESLTSPETYNTIRDRLLSATQAIIDDGVEDVLILDIARQDQ